MNNTFIGGIKTIADSGSDMVSAMNADPRSSFTINTLPVNFYGMSLGGNTITVDFSWYGPYRTQAHSVIAAFLWIGFILLLIKALPSILGGSSVFTNSNDGISSSENAIVETIERYEVDSATGELHDSYRATKTTTFNNGVKNVHQTGVVYNKSDRGIG